MSSQIDQKSKSSFRNVFFTRLITAIIIIIVSCTLYIFIGIRNTFTLILIIILAILTTKKIIINTTETIYN